MGTMPFKTEKMRRIEAQLEQDRAALVASMGDLGRMLPANASHLVRGGVAAATTGMIAGKPLALAAVGMGLGMGAARLLRSRHRPASEEVLAGTRFEALSRWEDEGGMVTEPRKDERTEEMGDGFADTDTRWIAELDRLRDYASALLARIDRAMRQGLAPVSELAAHRAEVVAVLARDTRRVLASGLEHLSSDARGKAVKARQAAYDAQRRLRDAGATSISEKPFLTAMLFAAVGAAVASALRQTKTENRVLGPARDHLIGTAKALANDEARRIAQTAVLLFDTLKAEMDAADDPNRAAGTSAATSR